MINEVILVGQMLDRPRLSTHPDGSHYTQFRVCVEDMYREIEGKNHKNVVECVAYGYVSERICKFFHCGKYIKIYGALNSVQIQKDEIEDSVAPTYQVRVWVKSIGFFDLYKFLRNHADYSLRDNTDMVNESAIPRTSDLFQKKEPKKTIELDEIEDIDVFYDNSGAENDRNEET